VGKQKGLTRAIRFEVVFASARREDKIRVQHKLWNVMDTLTRASNRAIRNLWLVYEEAIPRPVRPDGKPAFFQTLAYQVFNGTWDPTGSGAAYKPYRTEKKIKIGRHGEAEKTETLQLPGPAGLVLTAQATVVHDRLKTDLMDIRRGKKSLASFRNGGIPITNQGVKLREDGTILFQAFGNFNGLPRVRRGAGWVALRPRKIDKGSQAILEGMRTGRYKMGTSTLLWKQRPGARGKWMLSITFTDLQHKVATFEPEEIKAVVAGIDTGIRHATWTAFVDGEGKPLKRPELVHFPRRTLRALAWIKHERQMRGLLNAAVLEVRAGRGRSRKIRALDHIADRHARLVVTMIQQTAAATIQQAIKRGATLIVVEDHGKWSVDKMHAKADRRSRSEGRRIRGSFFRWHEAAMREQLLWVAKREGVQAVAIDPAWTSRTCHQCSLVHKRDWVDRSPKEGEIASGRISPEIFHCASEGTQAPFEWADGEVPLGETLLRNKKLAESSRKGCDYRGQADHNAAINIARRGILAAKKVEGKVAAN